MIRITIKKPCDRKSLHLITNIFDVKKITAIRRVGAANKNTKLLKLDVACEQEQKKRKGHLKRMNRLSGSFINV